MVCFSSMYFDEDGHLAHEFYKETQEKNSGKVTLKKIRKGLRKQVSMQRFSITVYFCLEQFC